MQRKKEGEKEELTDAQREKEGEKEGLTDAQTQRERERQRERSCRQTHDHVDQITILVPST